MTLAWEGLLDTSLVVLVHTSKTRVNNTLAHLLMPYSCDVYLVSATTVSDKSLFIFVTELGDGTLRVSLPRVTCEVCGKPGNRLVFISG